MASRSPRQIDEFLAERMPRMDLPVQYLGDEPNTYRKPWESTSVRWLLLASWAYEAAAGNQSIPAVYKAVNIGREDFLCDRFYLPATPRDLKSFQTAGIPVFGIESKHQLADFDVVATSISYSVLAFSFVKMLSMSDIPVRRAEREEAGPENFPMIMVGGQSYGAPEFLAPVIDCFWLGEVEDEPGQPGIATVTARVAEFKESGLWSADRVACYAELAREFPFLYFPRFVDVHYGYEDRTHMEVGLPAEPDGVPVLSKQVVAYTSNLEGMVLPRVKRHVKNMDAVVPLDNQPLLYADPGMGAGDLEVGRGCPAWCSFCALSFRQKPYRQRSVSFMETYAKSAMLNMGATRLTPFMPDFPMHTQRKKLIATLLERVSDEVDAPAMRVDDFIADGDFILLQVHGGMDGVTLGLEGNSQRMRDLVGKGTSDADVKEAVALAIQAGIRKIKLFMITDLPGEDVGDVFRILRLAREIADIRDSMGQPNVRIQFSWTPLLIEANTPFQWFPVPSSTRTLGDVWEDFRDLKIEFKLGAKAEPNKAAFFQLCQRASREVGEALVDTMLHYDVATWGGVPDGTRVYLEERLKARGFHNGYEDCFDERDKADMFGYEFVDQGVSVELLWQTFVQMREFAEQTDSDTYDTEFGSDYHGAEWVERCDSRCMGRTCGVCDKEDLKIRAGYIRAAKTERDVDLSSLSVVDQRSLAFKVRARLDKGEKYRLVGNDHWRFNLRRAAFQAQDALGWEAGIAKRSIRFASDTIKYHDWTSGTDYVEFAMTRIVSGEDLAAFVAVMNERLCATPGDESTRWLRITEWTVLPGASPLLRSDVDLSLFELEVDHEPVELAGLLRSWREADHVPMVLRSTDAYFGGGNEEVDAKSFVDDVWVIRRGAKFLLRMLVRGRPSPYNVYAAFTGKRSWRSVAGYPARRLDAFLDVEKGQGDFLRPDCLDCGFQIPVNVLDRPYHPDRCPRCLDRHEGLTVEEAHLV